MSCVQIDGTKLRLRTHPGHRRFIHRFMSEGVTIGRPDTLDCLGRSWALVLPPRPLLIPLPPPRETTFPQHAAPPPSPLRNAPRPPIPTGPTNPSRPPEPSCSAESTAGASDSTAGAPPAPVTRVVSESICHHVAYQTITCIYTSNSQTCCMLRYMFQQLLLDVHIFFLLRRAHFAILLQHSFDQCFPLAPRSYQRHL